MPPEPLRVLLADDEPLVRAALRTALERLPGFVLVGEAVDGLATIEAIERLAPDLVLLDVQMPGCDGFDVLAHLEPAQRPAVVFVTAYEQYALRAFDAHAIDYLLKPFDDDRLATALARARTWIVNSRRTGADDPLPRLLADVAAARHRDRFVVKHAGRFVIVPADDVEWIEARGNYVHLHHQDGPFLLRETLTALERTLDDRRFVRVHRSAIVALPAVRAVEPLPGGDRSLVLASGARVRLGRSHRRAFERAWSGPR
jgi:two-component system, LytTR family, response regulator